MSSAVSANYEQTRSTHGGAVNAARSIEHTDRHVQERGILEELNSLIGGLTGAASKNAAADGATPSLAAAANDAAAAASGKYKLLSIIRTHTQSNFSSIRHRCTTCGPGGGRS